MTTSFSCLACSAATATPVFLGCRDYYLGHPSRVDYHRCSACGLLQQSPLPSDPSSFYTAYPIHERKSAVYSLLRRLVMGRVYHDARSVAPGTLLVDYGCGDGGYLEMNQGTGLDLVGFEADPDHAARLSVRLGLPVFSDREDLVSEYAGRAGVVTMHFVLEHVTDLDQAFGDAERLLRPGGTFYYVVPDASSFEARLFGRRWHNLDPPRHISFPDARTARLLAGRHGFEPEGEWAVPFPNGLAASLSVSVSGRFRFPFFAAFLPAGIVFSRICPGGCRAYRLRRL